MSTGIIPLASFASEQVTIYLGIPILIAGLIGDLINTTVFLSLQTFRQNSCAFYLTIMSIVNIGHLITGLLSRILISGFNIDWTQSSIFYCKFRAYCYQSCVLTSITCMCLATIDQFLATCSTHRWQQWSHIKVAHRLTIGFIIIWLLHGIPHCIYYNQIPSTSAGQYTCVITNDIFPVYYIGVQTVTLIGLLPILINVLFALLAYRNVRNLAHRAIPVVRRELDKQLTTIVLIQAVYYSVATIPYIIANTLTLIAVIMNDSVMLEKLGFVNVLTIYVILSELRSKS